MTAPTFQHEDPYTHCCDHAEKEIQWRTATPYGGPKVAGWCMNFCQAGYEDESWDNVNYCPWCGGKLRQKWPDVQVVWPDGSTEVESLACLGPGVIRMAGGKLARPAFILEEGFCVDSIPDPVHKANVKSVIQRFDVRTVVDGEYLFPRVQVDESVPPGFIAIESDGKRTLHPFPPMDT